MGKTVQECGLGFHCYYLLLYSGLDWPEIVQQRENEKLKKPLLWDHYYQEPTEDPSIDQPSLKHLVCGRLCVEQLIVATGTHVEDSSEELAMDV